MLDPLHVAPLGQGVHIAPLVSPQCPRNATYALLPLPSPHDVGMHAAHLFPSQYALSAHVRKTPELQFAPLLDAADGHAWHCGFGAVGEHAATYMEPLAHRVSHGTHVDPLNASPGAHPTHRVAPAMASMPDEHGVHASAFSRSEYVFTGHCTHAPGETPAQFCLK